MITTLPQALTRIDDLNEEIADLKRKLGLQENREVLSRMTARWRLTGREADLALLLYQMRGRTASKAAIMDALYRGSPDEPHIKIVDVFVCKLRNKMGHEVIATEWGAGYRMTPFGLAAVADLLDTDLAEIEQTARAARAARPVRPARTVGSQRMVLEFLMATGSGTVSEAAGALRMPYARIHTAMSCLTREKRAKVVDWRKGADGFKRTIYAATDKGRSYYARGCARPDSTAL